MMKFTVVLVACLVASSMAGPMMGGLGMYGGYGMGMYNPYTMGMYGAGLGLMGMYGAGLYGGYPMMGGLIPNLYTSAMLGKAAMYSGFGSAALAGAAYGMVPPMVGGFAAGQTGVAESVEPNVAPVGSL